MIRPVTVWVVSCDWPGCNRDSADVYPDASAVTQGEALCDWVDHEAVDATNGEQFCDEHATSVCVECGQKDGLIEGFDHWFRCPEHHLRDGVA